MKHVTQPGNRPWTTKPTELIFLLSLVLLAAPLNGQKDEEENGEDVYEISPFVVQEDDSTGYLATSTLAGTRLRSSLEDIGASVQVITTEFLDDIGATESNDLLLYTTATETAGLGGNFSGGEARGDDRVVVGGVLSNPQGANRVRGLGSPDNTRDFFLTDIPFENYNTGRIEINRGANAILFGLGSPSGVLNAGLNRAVFDTINSVDVRVQDGGKHYSTRGSVDFNRVLIEDRLAIRVNALQSDRSYSQKPAFQDQERYYVTATWTPLQNTNIRLSYENGHIRANNPDPVGPLQAIDHYIREIGRLHAAQLLDPDYADEAPLPLVYDPWNYSMRAVNDLNGMLNQQIDGADVYTNPFGNQGLGQTLAMVWSDDVADPDFGFQSVIANAPNQRPDYDPVMPGFQHKVYYDARRPYPAANAQNPRGGRNFRRIDNAGSTTTYQNPWNSSGAYEGFNDLELFDFSRHLLAGTAPFQNRDFDAFHAVLEQTFFDNKLGFEIAFTEQHFRRKQMHGFPGRTMGIMVDLNQTLPIGSFHHNTDPAIPVTPEANPNYGRPFMVGKTNENHLTSDRRSWRWTGFWEFDTEDWFGDNIFSQILGRSVLTGLASRQEVETKSIALSQRFFGPREANLNENFSTRPDPRHFNYLVYLGPPVDLESNPAGITRDMFEINPVNNQQIWNPGGYVKTTFFDYTSQEMLTMDLERRLAAVNGENNGTVNDSLAAIMQSFLLDENIVTTLGWRQDEVTNLLANTPILIGTETADSMESSLNIANNNYEYTGTVAFNNQGEYLFEDPELTFVKEDIFSWGAVAKLPKEWNPIEWLDSASIFYNTSENFQPAPGREDHLGRQLPSPTGETEDIGFNFSFGGGKYSLRINRFEAAIANANNATVNRVFAQAAPGAINGFVNNMLNDLAYDDFEEIIDDETDPNFGDLTHIPRAEAIALFNEYTNHLGANIDLDAGTITLDQSNPLHRLWIENNWRLTFDSGQVDGLDQNQAGQTDTLDQVSKGYEMELVANPVRGMRVLLNVAKVETANSNIAPTMRKWIEEEFGPWHAGTPENPSKFGAIHRGNPFLKPQYYNNNNTNAQNYADQVLRDWEVIKAQEGTFSPEVRKWRLNAVVNYDFQEGFLRGFGVGFSTRYQSRVAIGFPIVPDAEGIPKPDITNPFFGPSEINWGFRFSYRTRIFDDKVNWRIQLNLSNIFSDEKDLIPVRVTDNGTLAQSRTAAPKGFVLSSRFDW